MIIRSISAVKCANECVFNGAKMLKQKKNATNCLYYSFCTTFVRCFSISRQEILRVSANKA